VVDYSAHNYTLTLTTSLGLTRLWTSHYSFRYTPYSSRYIIMIHTMADIYSLHLFDPNNSLRPDLLFFPDSIHSP
jgi:hypothetical protein